LERLTAERQSESLENIAVIYWLARSALQHAPLLISCTIAGNLVVIACYVFGCRTFRLRLLIANLASLTVVTISALIGVMRAVAAGVLARCAERLYRNLVWFSCT
jgi:hypothetical protein